jgi:hypothetical protein
MDHFAIRSEQQLFTPNGEDEEENAERFRGTAVQMALANDSTRELSEVMEKYIDPEAGFIRTEIPVLRFFGGQCPISRSEARRLGAVLADFREAELDFTGIQDVGRDFAHELFTVAAGQYPTLRLSVKNASETVMGALRRAGYARS